MSEPDIGTTLHRLTRTLESLDATLASLRHGEILRAIGFLTTEVNVVHGKVNLMSEALTRLQADLATLFPLIDQLLAAVRNPDVDAAGEAALADQVEAAIARIQTPSA